MIPSVVTAGISKRAGTMLDHALGSTTPTIGDNYRLEKFVFAASERYRVVYGTTGGAGIVRVFDRYAPATADEATVTISSNAQTYLSSSPTVLDRLRFVATPDRGYFVNTDVTPAKTTVNGAIDALGIPIASAGTVTITDTAHGRATGDYLILSATTSTPPIDGGYTITVTGANTFTIVTTVATTVAGTGNWALETINTATWPVKMTRTALSMSSRAISAIDTGTDVLSTAAAHGLTTGQQIVISGSSTTPSINGTQTVTVTSPTDFTIGVNITAVVTTGAFVAKALFAIDTEAWTNRASGTTTTNPDPPFISGSKKIRDVCWQRGRFWIAAGQYVLASDAQDPRNFFYRNASDILDSDYIKQPLGQGIADIDFLVPINRAVLAFCRTGVQYELGTSQDTLSQSTVVATPMTRLAASGARPAVINQNVYFCVENARTAELRELQYDPTNLPSTAEDVSAHAGELMFMYRPQDGNRAMMKTIVASQQNGAVLIFRTEFSTASYRGSDVFDYRTRFSGQDRIQQAWSRQFYLDNADHEYLLDICADGNDLLLLRGYALAGAGTTNFYIESMPILPISSHRVT